MIVRNFRFLRNEDDEKPLPVAAYRPGDSVWARFDMTGYKLGDKNQVDIEYGLTVLREDGSVAYTEPQAANQKTQTFYPQRYQPGVLNLNLAKDQPLGKYTIVLVRPRQSGQANVRNSRDIFRRVATSRSMALFRTRSAAVFGIEAHLIDVEVDMYPGGSARDFITVGMPDTAVRESRERIKSALLNSGFGYPNKSVTINLAPANVRKEGAGFDLPMALGHPGRDGNRRQTSGKHG